MDKRHSDLTAGEPGKLCFSKWRRSTRPAALVASGAPESDVPGTVPPLAAFFPELHIPAKHQTKPILIGRPCVGHQGVLSRSGNPGETEASRDRRDLPVVPGNPGQREHIPGDTGTPSSPVPVLAHWLGHTGQD